MYTKYINVCMWGRNNISWMKDDVENVFLGVNLTQ